jgi:hypothetical protein
VPLKSGRQSNALASLIETIIGEPGVGHDFARPRALFEFANFLRFPRNAGAVKDATTLCTASYVTEFLSLSSLGRELLKTQQTDILLKFANPAEIIKLCLSENIFQFHFYDYGDDSSRRTIADIVRFLISYNPDTTHSRDQASVKKAHYFFRETSGFGVDQGFSWRRFCVIWSEFKAVSAFIYVDEYHFRRQLMLDPASEVFFDRVEHILQNQTDLIRFFRQSLYVWNELTRRLDKRTWPAGDRPHFPRSMKPFPVTNAPIDKQAMRIMAKYRS